jgi:hypothetical protein
VGRARSPIFHVTVALAPPPGFRAFFSVSFFHFVLEMIGGFPGISPPEAARRGVQKKGKADLSGSASFVDVVGQEQGLQTQRKKPWALAPKNSSNQRLHKNGKALAI